MCKLHGDYAKTKENQGIYDSSLFSPHIKEGIGDSGDLYQYEITVRI